MDNCRAAGNALALNLQSGDQASVMNNPLAGEGNCLVEVICEGSCDGSESVEFRNNIFVGATDFMQPFENACFLYQENFPSDPVDVDYSVIDGGTAVSALNDDYDGRPRDSQPDISAYE